VQQGAERYFARFFFLGFPEEICVIDAGGISSALAAVLAGAKHAFLPKFTAAELSNAIVQYQATAMIAVPTMLQDLVQFHQQHTTCAPVCFLDSSHTATTTCR
jgi:hypothetical protein